MQTAHGMIRIRPDHRPVRTPRLLVPGLAMALGLAGCAGGAVGPAPPAGPEPAGPADAARGVPGFDTRTYPGDEAMTRWLDESPYRWVGFYLPAPCYTGTSWQRKRSTLRDMGWGLAVLFVGEQDWPQRRALAADSAAVEPAPSAEGDRCTRDNLSAEQGRTDGAAAAAAAAAEGFPEGTVVYLDVEPVQSVSDALAEYVTAWTRGLVQQGYAPGLYAHARNAARLTGVMTEAVGQGAPAPRLWVASTGGFSLRRAPGESGFPATVWQGDLDVDESWGGTELRIDRNVADRVDPSG